MHINPKEKIYTWRPLFPQLFLKRMFTFVKILNISCLLEPLVYKSYQTDNFHDNWQNLVRYIKQLEYTIKG